MSSYFHLKVGDEVVLTDLNFPPRNVKVTKVGTKYFYVSWNHGRTPFSRQTGGAVDNYGHNRVYTIVENRCAFLSGH